MGTRAAEIPSRRLGRITDNFLTNESFQNLPSVLLKDLSREIDQGHNVLEHVDIAVYALLKAHARFKGECHPSLERLAKLAGCSVSTIQRSLKRLEAAGHIQRKTHTKGKIFLLTDVTKTGQIVRKNRISFAPPLFSNPRFTIPPAVEPMANAPCLIGIDDEGELPPEDDDPPF
jgi:DNA-binding MarR family transcriptional regulator